MNRGPGSLLYQWGIQMLSTSDVSLTNICNTYPCHTQRTSMRGDIRIGRHGNRRWRQIQIQIQVYNAERPLTCGTPMNRPPYNGARPARTQTISHGRCYDITRSRVNNGIKTPRHTNLFQHCYVHNLSCICAIVWMEIVILKSVLFLKCVIHAIWLLGPEVFKDLVMFSNRFYFSLHMVSSISHHLMTRLYS